MNSRTLRILGALRVTGAVGLLGLLATGFLSGDSSAAPVDIEDWPEAVNVTPDGRVWLAMQTDVRSLGGLARYSGELEFELGWGLEGPARAIGHGPDGHVHAAELDMSEGSADLWRVSRFEPDGAQQGSIGAEAEVRALALDRLGSIFLLEHLPVPNMPTRQRVARYAAGGARLDTLIEHTWPYVVIDLGSSAADEWVYVATASDNIGAEGRVTGFGPAGTGPRTWRTPGQPLALSVDGEGRVHVADMGVVGGSFSYRFIVYDAVGAELWRCPVENASILDIAAGLGGQAYLLVDPLGQSRHQLRRYGPDCEVLDWIDRFAPVQHLPRPLTATPAPTATPDPSHSATPPAPATPSTSTLTPDPSRTLSPPTSTPTPTPTPSPSTTPSQVTCTPPACPCGRLVGVCPHLVCLPCTETPIPHPAYLPILNPG